MVTWWLTGRNIIAVEEKNSEEAVWQSGQGNGEIFGVVEVFREGARRENCENCLSGGDCQCDSRWKGGKDCA